MIRILQHGCLPPCCQIWTDMFQQVREVDMDDTHTLHRSVCTHVHTRAHTHRFAHKSSVTSPDRQMPLGIPGSWAKQKSVKMCSSVEMQSVIQLSKTSSYVFSWRLEGKRPESFYSTFTRSSTVKFKLNNFVILCLTGNNCTQKVFRSFALSNILKVTW